MSGYTPPPGVYFSDSFYLYSASASKTLSFPFGRLTAIGITANLITNIAAVAWYTDVKIFGGTLGFAAAIPSAPTRIPQLFHSSAPWGSIASSTRGKR